MAYKKQTWVDLETPLDAEHMNHIEDGIGSISEEIANKGNPTDEQVSDAVNAYLDVNPVQTPEIKTLQESINGRSGDVKEIINITGWVSDCYYDLSGTTVDLQEGTNIIQATNWGHVRIDYKAGDIYRVTGAGGNRSRLWGFVANDGTILNVAEPSTSVSDYLIEHDADCVLIVNALLTNTYKLCREVMRPWYGLTKSVEIGGFVIGVYYDLSGTTVDLQGNASLNSNEFWGYIRVDYKAGEIYRITGEGGDKSRLWGFVANDGTILNVADPQARVTDYILRHDTDCTLIVNKNIWYDTVLYKEEPESAAKKIDVLTEMISTDYVFGAGISCDYVTPSIPAFVDPGNDNRLSYFYGLYDALVSAHPDYVTKVDCDAEATSVGIVRPDALSDSPIYMYKFSPKFTKTSATDQNTLVKPIKLFITNGVHSEFMAIWCTYQMMRLICELWQEDENLEALRWGCEIYVIPCSTPYSVEKSSYVNHNGVNVNRNCPTIRWYKNGVGTTDYTGEAPASEYETKVFMHFLDTIKPFIYIDHHNSFRTSQDISWWGNCEEQHILNIIATAISDRSRKLRKRLEGVYPEGNWNIDGCARKGSGYGTTRMRYGYEQGIHSCTFETNASAFYENGANVVGGTEPHTSLASTIAVDGFLNFVLLLLKELTKQPSVSVN